MVKVKRKGKRLSQSERKNKIEDFKKWMKKVLK
jgi:hypothetical protein